MKDNKYGNTDHPPYQVLEAYGKKMKPNGFSILDRNCPALKERFQTLSSSPASCQVKLKTVRFDL